MARALTIGLWLIFGALVAVTLWVVLGACALGWPAGERWLGGCPVPGVEAVADPALARERERTDALNRAIRDLELAVLDRPYCPAPVDEPEQRAEPERPPCPPERRRATEVILLLDASTSMNYDFALDPAVERRLLEIGQQLSNTPFFSPQHQQLRREFQRLERRALQPNRIDRIDVAKQALTDLVDNTDPDVDFSFVRFSRCGNPDFVGRYGPPQRGALRSDIRRTQLKPATALAQGIAALPGVMNGGREEDSPVNVVLVSDGSDSCNGDPCAAARQLKQSRPYAFVNAIAIGGMADQVRCVPELTGGAFVGADDTDELAQALVQAAGQDLPEHCR
jgi:hypothetical protein